jgi:hypothetical protein
VRAVWLPVQDRRTALHYAVEGGHTAAMEWLVGQGAHVEARDCVRRVTEERMRVCVTGLGLDELLA